MQRHIYQVDPRMIPPVIMSMSFGAFLIFMEGVTQKGFLLFALLFPFYYLGAEILARRIVINENGVTVRKFLRSVHISWSEIDALDVVRTGRKVFLILQGGQSRPVLITNTIQPFEELLRKLMEQLAEDKVSAAVRELAKDPPPKYGPLAQAWIVCLLLLGIIVGKLLGYG
jgi:hypothetical protein